MSTPDIRDRVTVTTMAAARSHVALILGSGWAPSLIAMVALGVSAGFDQGTTGGNGYSRYLTAAAFRELLHPGIRYDPVCDVCGRPAVPVAGRWSHRDVLDSVLCPAMVGGPA